MDQDDFHGGAVYRLRAERTDARARTQPRMHASPPETLPTRASILQDKALRLFLLLAFFFVTNALLAEFIGVKLFSLERTFGFEPIELKLFTGRTLSFHLTAGVLLWPVVFVMTDIINEYYGARGVRVLSRLSAVMVLYSFGAVYAAIQLAPADFWLEREIGGQTIDMQRAFEGVFGQGLWIIAGSLTAFLVGQVVDVAVFHWVKRRTGERWIWLRATGSTVVSQFIDSFIVLYIAFGLGPAGWSMEQILEIGLVNYAFKFSAALALTPVIYGVHGLIERYLGAELAQRMRTQAAAGG